MSDRKTHSVYFTEEDENRIADLEATIEAKISTIGTLVSERRVSRKLLQQAEAALQLSREQTEYANDAMTAMCKRAEQAEAALDEANAKYRSASECSQVERDRAVAAEATLAERDRMLRLAWFDFTSGDEPIMPDTIDEYLADLRARAEEGSGDEA